MNTNEHELLLNRRKQRERRVADFLAGAESFVFFVAFCLRSYRQSNSSPRSCAFVSISGLDFVNLPRQTRLRGIAVRMSRIADNQILDTGYWILDAGC